MLRIDYSFYQLDPKGSLNSRASKQPRKGSLLRVTFEEGEVGYADCHPWVELGDLPLANQLLLLQKGQMTALTRRSLEMARTDARARKSQISLWENSKIPSSHELVIDFNLITESFLESLHREKKHLIKIKVGRNPILEARRLCELAPSFRSFGIQIRLDFNSSLSLSQFEIFLKQIEEAKASIDFIEDPIPYHSQEWRNLQEKWGIRLALDRFPSDASINPYEKQVCEKGSFSVLVLKPAIQDPTAAAAVAREMGASLVITSYLDHPVGQAGAAWVASELNRRADIPIEVCGLMSHVAYEENSFSNQLIEIFANAWHSTGIGFDQLLVELPWQSMAELPSFSMSSHRGDPQ